ncbi:MAG: orotate phosphoribosyltransferase [Acidobacteria bacterium]|nr:orotate phosphoribosyltransferase [Acidobacteriota bacterium]
MFILNGILAFVSPQAESILAAFRATGAYLNGHFRLTSGMHSSQYLQCALVLQHPAEAELLGRLLGAQLRDLVGGPVSVVVSPALGGLIIGHEVARALGARHIFTERDAAAKMILRRGFTVAPGERAIVVEDVVTTGGSTRDVVDVLRAAGAEVLAAGSVIDRSGGSAQVGVSRTALVTIEAQAWQPEACPLCAQGIPVVKPGSRPV